MKKIGFIGAYDKTDFILYVAKILVEMGRKVLLVDGTVTQKAKYIVPVIKPSKSYVTEFEGIDIAVGFENFEEIKDYLGLPRMVEFSYDIALVDADSTSIVENFKVETFDKIFFSNMNLSSFKSNLYNETQLESFDSGIIYKVSFCVKTKGKERCFFCFRPIFHFGFFSSKTM